ncbi:MAG: WxcM-like domain-containing protein [Candidatus Levybacteria bacterium]|nr:WxcM-like domain-containing protein [Candidatus Levybacteria bacterium]
MRLQKINPVFVREDHRGLFVEASNGRSWKTITFGKMKKGAVMGNHYHKKTNALFFIIKGKVKIDNIDVKSRQTQALSLRDNEGIIFPPFVSHAIHFQESSFFMLCKSKKYNPKDTDTFDYVVSGKK